MVVLVILCGAIGALAATQQNKERGEWTIERRQSCRSSQTVNEDRSARPTRDLGHEKCEIETREGERNTRDVRDWPTRL